MTVPTPSPSAGDVAKLVEELRQVAVGLMNQASRDWDEQEEVIPILRMLGHLAHDSATALESLSRDLAEARAALERIAEHPEKFDDGTQSYGVGFAFWNVQKIARSVLPQKEAAR